MAHTYAVLEISDKAYEEIRARLKSVGYAYALGVDFIDMDQIRLMSLSEKENSEVAIYIGQITEKSQHLVEILGEIAMVQNNIKLQLRKIGEMMTGAETTLESIGQLLSRISLDKDRDE